MAYGYGYGGYPAPGGYYPPPPMPDQLAQLRQNQMQPPMMGQQMQTPAPAQNQQVQTAPTIPMQAQPASMTGPVFVNGEAGAKGYLVGANNTVMLIDADPDANTFWLKSADAAGMPSMRTFDYVERVNTPKTAQNATQAANIPMVEYVTRADFDALAARSAEMELELEALKVKKATTPKKSTKEDAE